VGKLRDRLVSGSISAGIGVLISTLFALGRGELAVMFLISGAFTGVLIYIWICILKSLFEERIDRLGRTARIAGHTALFMFGGVFGWLTGMLLSQLFLGIGMSWSDLFSGFAVLFVAIIALVSVIVGLGFYAVERLQAQLREKVEQLKEREWAEKELELARQIQTRLLPPTLVEGEGYTIASRNLPARFVAGDFYDVVRAEDGSVVLVVADVAGKGLGASLIMASVKAVLPFVAHESAANAMSILNRKLLGELGPREFVALALARFDPSSLRVELVNAGFPEPYVVSGPSVRALTNIGERLPLGVRADVAYQPLAVQLARGERLVFLSDGIPEAPAHGEPLGYDRVATMLGAMNGAFRGDAWVDGFLDQVRAAVDEGLDDDWTAVVVEVG
jgi:serine phosphatase RsbU (regulator of sigma subunit)